MTDTQPTPVERLDEIADEGYGQLPRSDARALLGDALSLYRRAASDYEAEWADIDANADRLEAGAADRRRQAADEAHREAMAAAAKIAEAGRMAVIDHAEAQALPQLPQMSAGREALLRDELALAIGDASGTRLPGAVLRVVQGPRSDLAALLLSPWGETFIASRGGLSPEARTAIRRAAIAARAVHGTPAEQAAARTALAAHKNTVKAIAAARSAASARTVAARRQHNNRAAALARATALTADR